jgi:hypothetical protein
VTRCDGELLSNAVDVEQSRSAERGAVRPGHAVGPPVESGRVSDLMRLTGAFFSPLLPDRGQPTPEPPSSSPARRTFRGLGRRCRHLPGSRRDQGGRGGDAEALPPNFALTTADSPSDWWFQGLAGCR